MTRDTQPRRSVPWPYAVTIASTVTPCPVEHLALPQAIGRTLSVDITARTDLPPFSSSAMDGWAVRGSGPWTVVGAVVAGADRPDAVLPGTAVRITTGARLPDGAEAIARAEHGKQTGRTLQVTSDLRPGSDLRAQGEERRRGDLLAAAGTVISPVLAGLAAAAGHDTLPVRTRPSVCVLVLGDELVHNGAPRDGLVRDALGVQLPAWINALGGNTTDVTYVGDDLDVTRKAIDDAVADVIVTTGGSSVGPYDHVRAAITSLDGTLDVDQVAVRPGHPMLLATLPDGRQVVGLPGNPGAAIAGILTLLKPLLAGLTGRTDDAIDTARVTTNVNAPPHAHRLIPGQVARGYAHPLANDAPAMLTGWAAAGHAVVVPPNGLPSESDAAIIRLPAP